MMRLGACPGIGPGAYRLILLNRSRYEEEADILMYGRDKF
jgi:hypothetical protein